MKAGGISSSINRTLGFLFLAQLVFTAGLLLAAGIRPTRSGAVIYILSLSLIHAGLWIFLLLMHEHFTVVHSGEKLTRINAANIITLMRISCIPTVALVFILNQKYPLLPVLLPLVALVFLTDLCDGALARAFHQVTLIGKYLDSVSDYALLIVVSACMAYYKIVPDWLVILALFRLVFQWFGMGALLVYQGYVHAMATLPGKVSVFLLMSLYGLAVLALPGLFPQIKPFLLFFEYFVAAVIVLSLAEKVLHLKRAFIEAKEVRRARKTVRP
jgi:phosphatidylglycerophosphate synthase